MERFIRMVGKLKIHKFTLKISMWAYNLMVNNIVRSKYVVEVCTSTKMYLLLTILFTKFTLIFIINVFKLIEKYPKLMKPSATLGFLKNCYKDIKQICEENSSEFE